MCNVANTHRRNRIKTVAQVISSEMDSTDKRKLASAIKNAIEKCGLGQGSLSVNLVFSNGRVQNIIITEMEKFLKREFQYRMFR